MAENDRDTGVPGFRIYADDTSRASGEPPRKGAAGEPDWNVDSSLPVFRRWEEDDWSEPEPLPPLRVGGAPRSKVRERGRFPGTLGIAVSACVLGIGVGLSWPELQDRFLTPRSMTESSRTGELQAAIAPAPTQSQAAVRESQVSEAPETAAPAPQAPPVPVAEVAPPAVAARPPAPLAERAEARSAVAEPARDASATLTAPTPPSSACAEAGTLGGQLGCEDPAVEAAHRRMESAYRLALEGGASPERLSADQARWLALRDRAAQTSRGALITAYQLRIQELAASARAAD